MVAGFYAELRLLDIKPVPAWLLEDFKCYENALVRAEHGGDPYSDRNIGTAFLYPPPALNVVGLFSHIDSFFLKVAVYTVLNLALLAFMMRGIAIRYGYSMDQTWYWWVLGFGFAPFLELLHIGQINMITQFGLFLLFAYQARAPAVSGFGLCLAMFTKVTPVLFVWPVLLQKQFRLLLFTGLIAVLTVALTVFRFGAAPFLEYPQVFTGLLHAFPLGPNSQSLVSKLAIADEAYFRNVVALLPVSMSAPVVHLFRYCTDHVPVVQRLLTMYLVAVLGVSGVMAFVSRREWEPLFLLTAFAMLLSPSIVWYHHYVFLLLPVFVWMAWSRLDIRVVLWCFLGLLIVQLDRHRAPHGLFVHLWSHVSLLVILAGQSIQFAKVCGRRADLRGAGSATRESVNQEGPE